MNKQKKIKNKEKLKKKKIKTRQLIWS